MKFLLGFLLISTQAFALSIPTLNQPVMDEAKVVDASSLSQLDEKIRDLHKKEIVQISILLIDTLGEENLEEFSIKVAEKWKLGDAKKDNGLLILMVINDRKIRIEVGAGLEGEVTDLASNRIINEMKPYLRQKEYGQGLLMAVNRIEEVIASNSPEAQAKRAEEALRLAEERELAKLKSEQATAAFMEKAEEVGVGVLAFIGIALLGMCAMKTKEPEYTATLLSKQKAEEKLDSEISSANSKLKENRADPEKVRYLSDLQAVRDQEGKISSMKSEIANMKRYLGES